MVKLLKVLEGGKPSQTMSEITHKEKPQLCKTLYMTLYM